MNALNRKNSAWRKPQLKWVLIGLLAVAAFLAWTTYGSDALGALPYLLLLACPLMHLFHRGHRHHGQGHHEDSGGRDTHRPRTGEKS